MWTPVVNQLRTCSFLSQTRGLEDSWEWSRRFDLPSVVSLLMPYKWGKNSQGEVLRLARPQASELGRPKTNVFFMVSAQAAIREKQRDTPHERRITQMRTTSVVGTRASVIIDCCVDFPASSPLRVKDTL